MASPQYETKHQDYEFRYRWDMPVQFRKRVCVCEVGIKYDFSGKSLYPYGCCARCGKPDLSTLLKCKTCGEVFIKDFSWPFECRSPYHTTCWDCSQKLTELCTEHTRIPMYKDGYPLREPLGLNPVKYTEEELDGSVFGWDD